MEILSYIIPFLILITFVIVDFTTKKFTSLNKNYFYFLFVNMISWLGVLTFFKIYEIQRAVLILNFLVVPIILFYLNRRRNLNYFAFAITLIIVITFQNNILNTNQIISDNDSVEDAWMKKELWDAIASLPKRQRKVVTMRLTEKTPYKEIANILGVSGNSAKVSYHHAVTSLKEKLKK